MNIVTGATGIIGSHIVLELLRQGLPVTAGKRPGSDISKTARLFEYYGETALFEKINWVDCDISDIFSLEEIIPENAVVYHCAGYVSFDRRNRKRLYDVNEQGTRNIVDACLYRKAGALCHVSSLAALHNKDWKSPLDESVFWKRSGKESDYARSKYNAEREVWRGIEEGLKAVIVNPGVVLSPGFWEQSSSRLFNTCFRGSKFYTSGTTGYIAATDVARIMLGLVTQRKFGDRYILVENNYSFQSIFDQIHRNFRKPVPMIRASRLVLTLGWIADSIISALRGKSPTLTRAVVDSALNKQVFSNRKIRETLSVSFIPTRDLLEQICALYLREKVV